MRFLKTVGSALGLTAFLLFALATPARAEHPAYLHALSNLRQARALLQTDNRPGRVEARNHAIEEIDKAIQEVKRAVHEEGKDTRWAPPPAAQGDPDRPLRSALGLLNDAHSDVAHGVDESTFQGLQERALHHIDEAIHAVDHAIHGGEHRY